MRNSRHDGQSVLRVSRTFNIMHVYSYGTATPSKPRRLARPAPSCLLDTCVVQRVAQQSLGHALLLLHNNNNTSQPLGAALTSPLRVSSRPSRSSLKPSVTISVGVMPASDRGRKSGIGGAWDRGCGCCCSGCCTGGCCCWGGGLGYCGCGCCCAGGCGLWTGGWAKEAEGSPAYIPSAGAAATGGCAPFHELGCHCGGGGPAGAAAAGS